MLKMNSEVVDKELKGLEKILNAVDSSYTGANGEEHYINGISKLEYAINITKQLRYNIGETIEYIIKDCKRYNDSYYIDVKYNIYKIEEDKYLVTIATER